MRRHAGLSVVLAVAASLLLPANSLAGETRRVDDARTPAPVRAPAGRTTDTEEAIDRALRARDFATADGLLAAHIKDGSRDPTILYNHACVLAQLGRGAEAEERLLECVKAGFTDFDFMESDSDLEPIRESRTYSAIMEARERLRARTPAAPARPARKPAIDPVESWRTEFGDSYRYESEDGGGIAYATYLDEATHRRMREMLARLERHLVDAYFEKPPRDRALVAIVRPEHASKFLDRPEIRGMYLHSARRLVSRDTGESLSHEFVHLLHFADMERRGQRHPIWIQEGLASLYETYTLGDDGKVEFIPNVRFNIARRQVLSGTAESWRELSGFSGERFMRDAERLYPQVRAIFEFFAREGRLEAFYRALAETARDDPTGVRAIERAFGQPLAAVETRWRRWMAERGAIDDRVTRGDASLGLAADDAGGGVRIRSFVPGSSARASGLRVGDVIFSVAGIPVRNKDELTLAVARLRLGEEVEVLFRRDDADRSIKLTPRPLGK